MHLQNLVLQLLLLISCRSVFTYRYRQLQKLETLIYQPNCTLPEGLQGECIKRGDCSVVNTARYPLNSCTSKGDGEYVCCQRNETPWRGSARKICRKTYAITLVIVRGLPTRPQEFRYMVALGGKSSSSDQLNFKCGGALISESYILTAAHCISDGFPSVAIIGGKNLSTSTTREIEEIFEHPDYDGQSSYNDIALLKLATPVNFSDSTVKIICLWERAELTEDLNITAIGYGDTRFAQGRQSEQLLKSTTLKAISENDCQPYFQSSGKVQRGIERSQICARDPYNVTDTCQGDSGGPIVLTDYLDEDFIRRPFVIGITSFGIGCAHGVPAVYTRVSEYLEWIESTVWPNGFT